MAKTTDINPPAPAPPLGLRDYFAAAALSGMTAKYAMSDDGDEYSGSFARWAYILADAMIAERGE